MTAAPGEGVTAAAGEGGSAAAREGASGWRERAALALYGLGWTSVRRLPEPVAYRLFDLVADVTWARRGAGVRQLEANLARARPGLDEAAMRRLSRQGMRSYLRYWCDSFRLPDWDERRITDTVRTVGDEPVRATLASGRGVVMFLGHLGNWDHAGAWSTTCLAPVTTVAERLRPAALFDRFVAFRERLGMTVVPLDDPAAFRRLGGALRAGGFVPLLADRDLTAGGIAVRFLGEQARMAVGPAALAVQTGAALHPVGIHYERVGRGFGLVITWYDEVPVPDVPVQGSRSAQTRAKVAAMTQACADALAGAVREHPQDWHVLQPVFSCDVGHTS